VTATATETTAEDPAGPSTGGRYAELFALQAAGYRAAGAAS
jgi:hypothetical protein